jgi:hypothetical protein
MLPILNGTHCHDVKESLSPAQEESLQRPSLAPLATAFAYMFWIMMFQVFRLSYTYRTLPVSRLEGTSAGSWNSTHSSGRDIGFRCKFMLATEIIIE